MKEIVMKEMEYARKQYDYCAKEITRLAVEIGKGTTGLVGEDYRRLVGTEYESRARDLRDGCIRYSAQIEVLNRVLKG